MIIGHGTLKEMFPNFKEDIQENGIDLRLGELHLINKKKSGMIGCIDGEKYPPTYSIVKPNKDGLYVLRAKNFYFMKVDRPIHIPKGHIQLYELRSTFSRCGLLLAKAVGDSDFQGTLMLGLYNSGPCDITIGANERMIQAITIKTDGTDTSYKGSYKKDKIYGDGL